MPQIESLTPITPHLAPYHWRSWQRDDIVNIQQLLQQIAAVDHTDFPSQAEIARLFDKMGAEKATNTITAVSPGGELAAIAFIMPSLTGDETIAGLNTFIHPAHRSQDMGAALMHWMESRAQQLFDQHQTNKPQLLRISCSDHLTDRISLYRHHGFEPVRYTYQMQRSLRNPRPQTFTFPHGLRTVQWQPEHDYLLMQAFNDAFAGHWGLPQMHEALWKQQFTGVPQFREDLTFLAMDGSTIVGFCLNWVDDQKNKKSGIQEGWIEAIGVLPTWRGRGLATALLSHTLKAFMDTGLEQAALDVDTQNPTGALRLYEKMGFTAIKRTAYFIKQIHSHEERNDVKN